MKDLEVEGKPTFLKWLEEEKSYLQNLSKEPLQETLEMDYYQQLLSLKTIS